MPQVLMVDDDVETLSVVEEFLRHAQFETKVCSDPRNALDVFEAFGPDICLLNFNMPYMTGAALMEKIKSIDSTVEVIFMTPENQAVLAIHLMRCGAHDYLLKPVGLPHLRASLDRALDHRRLVLQNNAHQLHLE